MAADQGIRIAEDGVAEVSMTEARAQLTRLIRRVREDGRPAAFTERGERRAYVVTPAMFKRAKGPTEKEEAFRQLVERLERLTEDPKFAEVLADKDPDLHDILDQGAFHILL
ncbi:type II toxin-antitoxin system Phd/YefM family antitoxin [Streptomyces ziwulingensis]